MASKSKNISTKHDTDKLRRRLNEQKTRANSHQQHDSTSVEHNLPSIENMLVFNEINFSPLIVKTLMVLAMQASADTNNGASSNATPHNLASYFEMLPVELLGTILTQMPVPDRIDIALAYPEYFMSEQLNIFVADAYHQLNMPIYVSSTADPEQVRRPLYLDALADGKLSVEVIGRILDLYEQVCIQCQLDPHTFIHATFANNAGNDQSAPSGTVMRNIIPPIHMAVHSGRLDYVKYLIQRGARADQAAPVGKMLLTPFQYALDISLNWRSQFPDYDLTRRKGIENIALELIYTSPNQAYMANDFTTSPELDMALSAGLEDVALHFLEQFEASPNPAIDRNDDRFKRWRNRELFNVLLGDVEMPKVITFMLEHGAIYQNDSESMTTIALEDRVIENAVACLRFEIKTQHPYLPRSIQRIAEIATHDSKFLTVYRLLQEIIAWNHVYAQRRILWNMVIAGNDAVKMRQWFLESASRDILDGGLLRMAIRHRDRRTVKVTLDNMLSKGESIDQPLPRGPVEPVEQNRLDVLSNWADTPLTFALAQENYYEAAVLLSLGANLSLVPPNIRHRVCKVRDRVNEGTINPIALVFRNDTADMPKLRIEAINALNYCFSHLIDSPDHPMPFYVRTPRNMNRPLNDTDNDSLREEDPSKDSENIAHYLITKTYPNTP